MVKGDLNKSYAFVGQSEKERRNLEDKIKSRYQISNWNVDNEIFRGTGYKIIDKKIDKELYFSPNSRLTLETRYLEKDNQRKITENVLDLFARVAVNIAEADLKYDSKKDIVPVAEEFLESLIYQEFMPNTPTLCNAGRSLQQLSACFVLPIEDYMATDDIGEDPEKQGNGIFDTMRYMSMIHKSGGGTGFNFGHLRPKTDRISTTFGSSSGPISFLKVYDSATDAVNQGGFRRGANMGILPYTHPDIFEFIGEKARNHNITNFNLSVGVDKQFMDAVKNNEYFDLISPKDEKTKSLEERVWKKENLLVKGTKEYNELIGELNPSLIIDEDGESVINVYNNNKIGRVGENGNIQINASVLFDEIAQYAWEEGCPGIIFLDRLEADNKTPHIGKIESTNPCGEQPLLPFEACNLGGINLATCVENGEVNYKEIDRRIERGVHFLDNVIDMSKFPFKKIYEKVHGTRKIGMGLMGWAEMLIQLGIPYDSDEAIDLAKNISKYVTNKARDASIEIAKERGVFPYWKGSVWEKEGKKVRNATVTTIAPNGTTGMIADANGGIEPFFKLAYKKTCMDGKELTYIVPQLVEDLKKDFSGKTLEKILEEVKKTGGIQNIEGVSDKLKNIYKQAHNISPEWHVKMQGAFQYGVDNAVSKTVNLPEETTIEDIKKIYQMAWNEGCIGITVFRDKSKEGVYSGLEEKAEGISLIDVEIGSKAIKEGHDAKYYNIKKGDDTFHLSIVGDFWKNKETKQVYILPSKIFQNTKPLGKEASTEFAQSGLDRTGRLKSNNPDYAEMIKEWKSVTGDKQGIGPNRINSPSHGVGLAFEHYCLSRGLVEYDEQNNLKNVIDKQDLEKIKDEEEIKKLKKKINQNNGKSIEHRIYDNISEKFECPQCHSAKFHKEAGCSDPVCNNCGWSLGKCG